jgi:hypothetical protein
MERCCLVTEAHPSVGSFCPPPFPRPSAPLIVLETERGQKEGRLSGMTGPRELSMSTVCLFAVFLVVTSDTMSGAQLDIIKQVASAGDQASLEASLQEALDKLRLNTLTIGSAQPGSVTAVVGGGLSGLTAALHLLEKGVPVALIDKSKFMGGNSAKASSGTESRLFSELHASFISDALLILGINAALTTQQRAANVDDSADKFFLDTLHSSQRERTSHTGPFPTLLARHAMTIINVCRYPRT